MQDHLGKQKTIGLDSATEWELFERGKGFYIWDVWGLKFSLAECLL